MSDTAADIGLGLLRIREAHRNCRDELHDGHAWPDCPILAEFRRMVTPREPQDALLTGSLDGAIDEIRAALEEPTP